MSTTVEQIRIIGHNIEAQQPLSANPDPMVRDYARNLRVGWQKRTAERRLPIPVIIHGNNGTSAVQPEFVHSILEPGLEALAVPTQFDIARAREVVLEADRQAQQLVADQRMSKEGAHLIHACRRSAEAHITPAFQKRAAVTLKQSVGEGMFPVTQEGLIPAAQKVQKLTDTFEQKAKRKGRKIAAEIEVPAEQVALKVAVVASEDVMKPATRGKGKRERTVQVVRENVQDYAWDMGEAILEEAKYDYAKASKIVSRARKHLISLSEDGKLGEREKQVLKEVRARITELKRFDYFDEVVGRSYSISADSNVPPQRIDQQIDVNDARSVSRAIVRFNRMLRAQTPEQKVKIDMAKIATERRHRLMREALEAENARIWQENQELVRQAEEARLIEEQRAALEAKLKSQQEQIFSHMSAVPIYPQGEHGDTDVLTLFELLRQRWEEACEHPKRTAAYTAAILAVILGTVGAMWVAFGREKDDGYTYNPPPASSASK